MTLRQPRPIKFVIANRAVRAELNGKCATQAWEWVYSTVWRSREDETCLYFDGTAKLIYSAALLPIGISEETANSHPFLQSAFPGLVNFTSIYYEKAEEKKSKMKQESFNSHVKKN